MRLGSAGRKEDILCGHEIYKKTPSWKSAGGTKKAGKKKKKKVANAAATS